MGTDNCVTDTTPSNIGHRVYIETAFPEHRCACMHQRWAWGRWIGLGIYTGFCGECRGWKLRRYHDSSDAARDGVEMTRESLIYMGMDDEYYEKGDHKKVRYA